MQLDGKRLGRFRPCLLLPVVLPIPHQAFKARSLWHQMNVGEGSRQNEGVSLVEALALKDATGARRSVGSGGSRVAGRKAGARGPPPPGRRLTPRDHVHFRTETIEGNLTV